MNSISPTAVWRKFHILKETTSGRILQTDALLDY
jgi:hypothetical protein